MAERSVNPVRGVLTEARKRRGWRQADLAERADCSIRRVSDAEAGRPVSPQLLQRMANASGIAYELLLKREEAQPAVVDLLPPRPLLVVGRDDEMEKLIGRYRASSPKRCTVQAVTAVRGWPGVGKTTLAAELLYQPSIREMFPDGVLWTSLGPAPNVRRLLLQWSRAVGDSGVSENAGIDEISQRLAGRYANRRMLLVIDDVWEATHARPFQVGGPRCGILLTTRSPRVAEDLTPSPDDRYLLDVLNDEDAIKLLEKISPRSVEASRSLCQELVQTIEGLPLAIQVTGHLLEAEARYAPNAQQDASRVKKLLNDIRSDAAKLLEETAPADMSDLVAQTTPTVAALLRKSTDALSGLDRERFAYLGAFASKPARFRLSDLAAVWDATEEEATVTVRVLADRGLLEPLDNGMYWVHALLVALAESLCTD